MRRLVIVLAVGLGVALAGCSAGITDINARPQKYYQHKVTVKGRIARLETVGGETLLELADTRDHRILVRSTEPVEPTIGEWVKVTGVLVPEARVADRTLYDVISAERVIRTRPPRFPNLM